MPQQSAGDRALIALLKRRHTQGMRFKPIQPDKYYDEARINDGDRLVHRIEAGALWVVDVVPLYDICRYGRKVEGLF